MDDREWLLTFAGQFEFERKMAAEARRDFLNCEPEYKDRLRRIVAKHCDLRTQRIQQLRDFAAEMPPAIRARLLAASVRGGDLTDELAQIAADIGDKPVESLPPVSPEQKKPRGKNVNARMLAAIQGDVERIGWNSTQWATHLVCSVVAVTKAKTWKDLEMRREREKAERSKDRRRRTKPTRLS